MIGYNYFKIEGQEYEKKKRNYTNIFITNWICKYNINFSNKRKLESGI